MMRNRRYEYWRAAIPLLLFFAFCIVKAAYGDYGDYAAYYYGSKELLNDNFLQVYDTDSFNTLIVEKYRLSNAFVSYTPFPPVTSLFIAPFLWMSIAVSKTVFNIVGAIAFTWSLVRLLQHLRRPAWLLLAMPVIFFIPLLNNIMFGQGYLILFAFLSEGYLAYAGRKKIAALWWGAAIMFKVFPALLVLFLLIRKEYKLAALVVGACALLFLASVGLNSPGAWQLYLSEIFPRLGNGELNSSFTPVFQSMFMLLKNLFVPDSMQNPTPAFASPVLFAVMLTIFQSALVFLLINAAKKKVNAFPVLSLLLFASLLLSPNGSSYSLALLVFPLLSLTTGNLVNKTTLAVGGLVLLCCNLPIQPFTGLSNLVLKFPRLYLLLTLFLVLLRTMRISLDYRWALPCLVFFALANMRKAFPGVDKSQYLLANTPAIISGYTFNNDSLIIDYWSVAGKQRKFTGLSFHPAPADVLIRNNQVFFEGRQLTNTADWKKQAMVVNNSIIYLSDKNRGVGFYTLRKLDLADLPAHPGMPGTAR